MAEVGMKRELVVVEVGTRQLTVMGRVGDEAKTGVLKGPRSTTSPISCFVILISSTFLELDGTDLYSRYAGKDKQLP